MEFWGSSSGVEVPKSCALKGATLGLTPGRSRAAALAQRSPEPQPQPEWESNQRKAQHEAKARTLWDPNPGHKEVARATGKSLRNLEMDNVVTNATSGLTA